MWTIILDNVPNEEIKKYGKRIDFDNYILIPKKKNLKEKTLLEYMNSEEYQNDQGKMFDSVDDFLLDLKKYKN